MTDYDQWLLNQADRYITGCNPQVVAVHLEPQDGEISREPIYNCENCEECDCEYWGDFND